MPQIDLSGPTIQKGQSLSDGLDCSQGELLRLYMPPDWTPAPLSFQVSSDGVQYYDCFYLTGYEITIPVIVPGSAIIVPQNVRPAIAWIKFRSGTRNYPVKQAATRVFAVAINTYPWILETGAWNDKGRWDDQAQWNDGVPARTPLPS